ncbi:MAG: hypothetical protein H6707_02355 [Deltaproteobacteria bacterium]|nr:hypothetical protein [Deltaproteobacteria bacterium]
MAKKKAATKKSRDVLVVASKVKDYIREQGLQSSADVVPALSEKIYDLLDEAAARTQNNSRVTVRSHDL